MRGINQVATDRYLGMVPLEVREAICAGQCTLRWRRRVRSILPS